MREMAVWGWEGEVVQRSELSKERPFKGPSQIVRDRLHVMGKPWRDTKLLDKFKDKEAFRPTPF
jgi:hypothetical protein